LIAPVFDQSNVRMRQGRGFARKPGGLLKPGLLPLKRVCIILLEIELTNHEAHLKSLESVG
jgi:hypothetical protein